MKDSNEQSEISSSTSLSKIFATGKIGNFNLISFESRKESTSVKLNEKEIFILVLIWINSCNATEELLGHMNPVIENILWLRWINYAIFAKAPSLDTSTDKAWTHMWFGLKTIFPGGLHSLVCLLEYVFYQRQIIQLGFASGSSLSPLFSSSRDAWSLISCLFLFWASLESGPKSVF